MAFRIPSTGDAVRVDGLLEEPAWADAVVIELPYEWLPGDNVPPPVTTHCLLIHDDRTLYIAFRALDPDPGDIRAHLWDRDQVGNLAADDYVGFLIDTFGDDRRAFEFRVSPLGVQADAMLSTTGGGGEDWSWDAIWEARARITETGYVVEIAIPFNQLRFPRTTGEQTWGLIAMRSWPRSVRHRMRSMRTDRDNSCLLCQSNQITGFSGLSSRYNVELTPTVTSGRTDRLTEFPGGDLAAGDLTIEPGFTARWGVTSNLTLNATIDPDFSQVEADGAQLEVNRRFALFFPEKRPFFLEGADLFGTPLLAVFTRTVADPSFGAKFSGKQGRNAFGIFATRDRVTNVLLPSNQLSRIEQIDQPVTNGVFRYRRDVGSSSTLGVLYTSREADGYHNRVYGLDGFLRLGDVDTVSVQYLRSDTAYPDAFADRTGQQQGAFAGNAFSGRLVHNGRDWRGSVSYRNLGPDFRADHGFVPRVDIKQLTGELSHIWWGDQDHWFQRLLIGAFFERATDHDGNLTDRTYHIGLEYSGPAQTSFAGGIARGRERFGGESFSLTEGWFNLVVRPTGGLNFGLWANFGDTIDVANVRQATNTQLASGIDFNLGRHLALRLSHDYQRLSLRGEEILTANLSQARLQYTFTPRMFARAILQYRRVHQNRELFLSPVDENVERLFTQLLFSYKLNPQTLLFVGYSDNGLGLTDVQLTRTDRTFFVKLGYAWVL